MTSAARDTGRLQAVTGEQDPSALLRALLVGDASVPLDAAATYCAGVSRTALRAALPERTWWAQVEHDGLHWLLGAVDSTEVVERLLPQGSAVGLPRTGAAGARRSLVDAREALALAGQREGVVRWGDDWVAATLVAAGPALDEACATACEVAARSPHLAEAVLAFAARGLSVVGAARSLHVHANTVIYRLERWQQLTGWDARTFPGLSLSVAALTRQQARS